jgi:predicted CopG family antitoxin
MINRFKNILISETNYHKLKQLGSTGESFNNVITGILNNTCPNCVLYRKEIDELKESFIEADYQSVRQQIQLRDEISQAKQRAGVRGG